MWTRIELKTNAKEVLRRTYWMGFAVCLVAGILGGMGGSSGGGSNARMVDQINDPIILMLMAGLMIFGIFFSIFVGAVIQVGKNDYFMSSRENDPSFSQLFSGFTKGNYLNIVKTMFLKNLFIVLWTFVFIIPGIIKTFQYIFVPYILAENSSISSKRARELSCEMTKGYKMDIFVLGLSFLGWQLLGICCCCIGIIFVTPYVEATFAELYAAHRAMALSEGYTDSNELCGF